MPPAPLPLPTPLVWLQGWSLRVGHVSCRSPAFSGISLSRFAACLPRLRQTQGNCFAESTVIKGRHSRFCHSVAGMPRRNVMADGKRLNPQLSDAEVETQMQLLQLAPRVPNFGGRGAGWADLRASRRRDRRHSHAIDVWRCDYESRS